MHTQCGNEGAGKYTEGAELCDIQCDAEDGWMNAQDLHITLYLVPRRQFSAPRAVGTPTKREYVPGVCGKRGLSSELLGI
jgi:hypothetical protein